METILNTIFTISKELDKNMLVPLSAILKYKGFRALIQTNMRFDKAEISFGFNKKKFEVDENLLASLDKLGEKLNILKHTHKSRSSSGTLVEIPLSQSIKIYKTVKYTLEALLAKTDNDIREQIKKLNMNEDEPELDLDDKQPVYYFTKVSSIFPLDFDTGKKLRENNLLYKRRKLRYFT